MQRANTPTMARIIFVPMTHFSAVRNSLASSWVSFFVSSAFGFPSPSNVASSGAGGITRGGAVGHRDQRSNCCHRFSFVMVGVAHILPRDQRTCSQLLGSATARGAPRLALETWAHPLPAPCSFATTFSSHPDCDGHHRHSPQPVRKSSQIGVARSPPVSHYGPRSCPKTAFGAFKRAKSLIYKYFSYKSFKSKDFAGISA